MTVDVITVVSVEELVSALAGAGASREVRVEGRLERVPEVSLPPGVSLVGAGPGAGLIFADQADGVRLTRDNLLAGLRLEAAATSRAVCNDTRHDALGTLTLRDVVTVGRVEIVASDAVRSGHVVVDGLDIEAADARDGTPRPSGYGVEVLHGAFTLHNRQQDPGVLITCDLTGLSAGRKDAPVRGGGIFVSGTDGGGRVTGTRLHTGTVHSDGRIPPGTPGQISGGVFVVRATVTEVVNHGPVTTYGPNDMVLDLWGAVETWTAKAPITSHGPSGIGFVNFGTIDRLTITAPIETFGTGARGFNIYDGTVNTIEFDRITTHADAAVGVQISKPFGTLTVHHGIETHGGTGESLVKGKIQTLAATALSLQPGTRATAIRIDGGITTHNDDVPAVEIHGTVGEFTLTGGIHTRATGPH
ncbi:hypothetical protein [Streptomyces albipurpureus]|uniref:Uncharacterized protein n=1 Tax=Streptomyces albipurpureus TaxID=2897419 RepID=A0ABT0UH40_9ACTN|nr:hypothetical protein [Streptomyces sp. CWNU-1]MCM2387631.1 hypothetical protein [Streptomyces sp. CWNU-1]